MIILKSKIPAALVTGKPAKAAKIKAEKAKTERTPKVKAKAAPKAKVVSKDGDALKHKLIASYDKRERALQRLVTLVAKKKEILKGIIQKIRKIK